MIHKVIYGMFRDEEELLHGVKELRNQGVKIREVYSPFPVHGLDHALGLKESRLGIVSFLCGLVGLGLAIWMTNYMLIVDWPVNIGGKPNFTFAENSPSFIPVIFELTVFCAAHGMVLIYLLRSRLIPGFKRKNPFPETTNDKFAVEIVANDTMEGISNIRQILTNNGAYEVREIY